MAADCDGSDTSNYQIIELSAPDAASVDYRKPARFVCSRRCNTEQGQACERVCALVDNAVHILSYNCDDEVIEALPACTHAIAELAARAECASFNASATCLVVGDSSGKLHFLLADGTLLFSQQLVRPVTAAPETATDATAAFHAISFAAKHTATEELVAVSASLQLIHICNISTSGLQDAANAKDSAALKQLRSQLSVHTASVLSAHPAAIQGAQVDLALHWLPSSSLIYVATEGGISVWSCRRTAGASLQLVDSTAGDTSGQQCMDRLFGGGAPTAVQLSDTGHWAVITDSAGGLSWWDAGDLLQLGRWQWSHRGAIISAALLSQGGPCTDSTAAAAAGPSVAAVFNGSNGRNDSNSSAVSASISVLQFSLSGVTEVFYCELAAGGCAPLLTALSGHRFLAVSAVSDSGAHVSLGREAVPLHRLRTLLASGRLNDALTLARTHSMDETDVHAAQLSALLAGLPHAATTAVSTSTETEGSDATSAGTAGTAVLDSSDDGSEDDDEEQCSLPAAVYSDMAELLSLVGAGDALERSAAVLLSAYYPAFADTRCALQLLEQHLVTMSSAAAESLLSSVSDALSRLATYALLRGDGALGCCDMTQWQWFRGCDLPTVMQQWLQEGHIAAAAVLWRRHATLSVDSSSCSSDETDNALQSHAHCSQSTQGVRLVAALPEALRSVPVTASVAVLSAWLQTEVLPVVSVTAVCAIKAWAEQHACDIELHQKRPHDALLFAEAVVQGAQCALSAAAAAAAPLTQWHSGSFTPAAAAAAAPGTRPLRAEDLALLSANHRSSDADSDHDSANDDINSEASDVPLAEVSGASGLAEEHWLYGGLDRLTAQLRDLTHLWSAHGLCLSLREFERLPQEAVLFKVLDRVQSPDLLPDEIQHHVMPLCVRHSLDPDAVLLSYSLMCAAALLRRRRPTGSSSSGGDCTTEQRAVAVVRCMSGSSSNSSSSDSSSSGCTRKSEAVLALVRSASFPFSAELWQLSQDALQWGGALAEDLQEAARVLQLAQIVQRHRVQGYDLLNPAHATRLVHHIAAQACHCPTALEDALQVAAAYSHLDPKRVYVDYLECLALAPAATAAAAAVPAVAAVLDEDYADSHTDRGAATVQQLPAAAVAVAGPLAAALSAHSARVTAVLERAPAAEAWCIAQEVLLFCLRLLDDHEMQEENCDSSCNKGAAVAAWLVDTQTEVRYATAAALSLAAFLQAQAQQPRGLLATAAMSGRSSSSSSSGGSSSTGRSSGACSAASSARQRAALHLAPAELLPVLRRLSALQAEFSLFPSVATLQRRPEAVWSLLKVHLASLDAHMRTAASSAATAAAAGSAAAASRNAGRGSGQGKKGGAAAVAGNKGVLSQLLQRARRLSELLGVEWTRAVGHAAHEAAKQGRVSQALDLCNGLFKDKTVLNSKDAALALRETAVALSTHVITAFSSSAAAAAAAASKRPHAATTPAAAAASQQTALIAAAHALRGLQQSAAMCDAAELPRTLDLLQGSETVAALLSRCAAGEEFDALLRQRVSTVRPPLAAITTNTAATVAVALRSKGKGKAKAATAAAPFDGSIGASSSSSQGTSSSSSRTEQDDAAAGYGLYPAWYRGDGLVMPLQQSLELVGAFVMQELRSRQTAAIDTAAAGSRTSSSGSAAAALAAATSRLTEFLLKHGALQLCLRVLAGMSLVPEHAITALHTSLMGLADKVLLSKRIDAPLAVGYMLALPVKDAFDVFKGVIARVDSDFFRRKRLATLGMDLARAWQNSHMLAQCTQLERSAHWTHVLSTLAIPVEWRRLQDSNGSNGSRDRDEAYLRSLVPQLLSRSAGDLTLALEYCDHYSIEEALPCLLYVEQQLTHVKSGPLDTGYQDRVAAVLSDVHDHHLIKVLQHLLSSPATVHDTDYECLAFMYKLLGQRSEQGSAEQTVCNNALAALTILRGYRSPFPLDASGAPAAPSGTTAGVIAAVQQQQQQQQDVYRHRLPFRQLQQRPLQVLQPQLTPANVANLMPLARPLGLETSALFSLLIETLFPSSETTAAGAGAAATITGVNVNSLGSTGACAAGAIDGVTSAVVTAVAAALPEWSEVLQWLQEVRSPVMACRTAQWVALRFAGSPATGRSSSSSSSSSCYSSSGITSAISALDYAVAQAKLAMEQGAAELPLLAVKVVARSQEPATAAAAEQQVAADKVYKLLKHERMELRHHQVVLQYLNSGYAAELSKFYGTSTEELLTQVFTRTAAAAAATALNAATTAFQQTSSTGSSSSSSSTEAGTMGAFRTAAAASNRAVQKLAEQRGYDGHATESLRRRLMRSWLLQAERAASDSSSGSGSNSGGPNGANGSRSSSDLLGDDDCSSVFESSSSEVRPREDMLAALQVAFVASVTASYEEDGASDYIARMDLKTNVEHLLSTAYDTAAAAAAAAAAGAAATATNTSTGSAAVRQVSSSAGLSYRSRLRALCAASLLAPRKLLADVWGAQRGGGAGLARYAQTVGYMVELEAMRLPHTLVEVLHCDREGLARALWRDHRDEPRLLPLLCDLLLDAQCTDVAMWHALLQRMVRRERLHRPLLLRILPRLSHAGLLSLSHCHGSSSHSSSSESSSSMPELWEEVMRRPLHELLQQAEKRTKAEAFRAKAAAAAAAAAAVGAPAPGAAAAPAALSFSASLFYTADSSSSVAAAAASVQPKKSATAPLDDSAAGKYSTTAAAVIEALDCSLYLLRCCPFADSVDAAWFAEAFAALGPRFHGHAVSAALCIPALQQRARVLNLPALQQGGSAPKC